MATELTPINECKTSGLKLDADYLKKRFEERKKERDERKQKIREKMEEGCSYRIRKLTPRECFRLMGVDDADIDKIQAHKSTNGNPISNSQQYKMAGNSIVVDVLFHIFRKMFVETESESRQLEFF